MKQKKSITRQKKNFEKEGCKTEISGTKARDEIRRLKSELRSVGCFVTWNYFPNHFLLCMYFYKGFFKKTQNTGLIEKISSMGKMRQTRYLRLITQMSLKKNVHNVWNIVYKKWQFCSKKLLSCLDKRRHCLDNV